MASRVDLVGIKQKIKSILDAANTTTGSPIDLSSDLANSRRVNQVLTVHPLMIPPQPSFYPFVTCYVEGKSRERDDIAKSQLDAFRRASIEVHVVGGVWNPNISNPNRDNADDDINYLMENVEFILRSNSNFDTLVKFQYMDSVKYFSSAFDHQTILRLGILKLNCAVFY